MRKKNNLHLAQLDESKRRKQWQVCVIEDELLKKNSSNAIKLNLNDFRNKYTFLSKNEYIRGNARRVNELQ